MSCSNCTCEECRENREDDCPDSDPSYWDEVMDDEAVFAQEVEAVVPPPIPLPSPAVRVTQFSEPKSEPLSAYDRVRFQIAFELIFAKHDDQLRVNLPTLTTLMMGYLSVGIGQHNKVSAQVTDFLREKAADPKSGYSLYRGRNGGFMKTVYDTETVGKLAPEDFLGMPKPKANDYTCKYCNTVLRDLSPNEKSCWKCGNPIQ